MNKRSLDNQIFHRCIQTTQQRDVRFGTRKMELKIALNFPWPLMGEDYGNDE